MTIEQHMEQLEFETERFHRTIRTTMIPNGIAERQRIQIPNGIAERQRAQTPNGIAER